MIASLRPVMPGLVLRAIVLWVLMRLLFLAVSALAIVPGGRPGDLVPGSGQTGTGIGAALSLAPPAALLVAVVVTALALTDVRAVRERAFLANLGVGLRSVAMVSFGVAMILETVMAIAI